MPKITLLSDLIWLHANENHVFFDIYREPCLIFLANFFFSGKTTNWRCVHHLKKVLRISLCYYLIFFLCTVSSLPFLIQISRGFILCVARWCREKPPKIKLQKEAKNNEKRHNYNACIIFLLRLMVVPSSYDNYTIKTHKFGTQKSVFLHSLLLPRSPSLAHGKNRKMRKKLNRFDPHEIVWSCAAGQWMSFLCGDG